MSKQHMILKNVKEHNRVVQSWGRESKPERKRKNLRFLHNQQKLMRFRENEIKSSKTKENKQWRNSKNKHWKSTRMTLR